MKNSIETVHIFVKFIATNNSVNRNKLYEAMREFGITNYFVKLVELSTGKMQCRARVDGEAQSVSDRERYYRVLFSV